MRIYFRLLVTAALPRIGLNAEMSVDAGNYTVRGSLASGMSGSPRFCRDPLFSRSPLLSSGFAHSQTLVPHCGVRIPPNVMRLVSALRNPSGEMLDLPLGSEFSVPVSPWSGLSHMSVLEPGLVTRHVQHCELCAGDTGPRRQGTELRQQGKSLYVSVQ